MGARTMTDNPNEALEYLRPDVEMIEVYRGVGQIPGEFLVDSFGDRDLDALVLTPLRRHAP